jgi:hypothetical protein
MHSVKQKHALRHNSSLLKRDHWLQDIGSKTNGCADDTLPENAEAVSSTNMRLLAGKHS